MHPHATHINKQKQFGGYVCCVWRKVLKIWNLQNYLQTLSDWLGCLSYCLAGWYWNCCWIWHPKKLQKCLFKHYRILLIDSWIFSLYPKTPPYLMKTLFSLCLLHDFYAAYKNCVISPLYCIKFSHRKLIFFFFLAIRICFIIESGCRWIERYICITMVGCLIDVSRLDRNQSVLSRWRIIEFKIQFQYGNPSLVSL